jgi:hypothetical protein
VKPVAPNSGPANERGLSRRPATAAEASPDRAGQVKANSRSGTRRLDEILLTVWPRGHASLAADVLPRRNGGVVTVAIPTSIDGSLGLDIAIRGQLAPMSARRNCSPIDPRVLAGRARSNWPYHPARGGSALPPRRHLAQLTLLAPPTVCRVVGRPGDASAPRGHREALDAGRLDKFFARPVRTSFHRENIHR